MGCLCSFSLVISSFLSSDFVNLADVGRQLQILIHGNQSGATKQKVWNPQKVVEEQDTAASQNCF